MPRLASALTLSHGAGLEEIATYMANMDRRCLFLIDEANKFVRHERANAYRTLEALRRMSEEGHCNFILAGSWELYAHAVLDYRSPLKNCVPGAIVSPADFARCAVSKASSRG